MPKVSVIVPNYNHAQYLKQRIDSILNQTYQDFELILLDDSSTDNSCEVLDSYKDHPKVSQFVFNTENSKNTFRQWAKGISLAQGEYIWIAESDDWAEPEFLDTLCVLLDNQPKVGLAYCNTAIYRDDKFVGDFASEKYNKFKTPHWQKDYILYGNTEIEQVLLRDCTINNASAVLMRKNLLDGIIPSLSEFRYSGDWFCYLQIATLADIAYCAKPLNNYRDHINNVSKQAGYTYLKELFVIYRWLLRNRAISNKSRLIQAMHLYVSDVYSTGMKWDALRDLKELYPLHPKLYFRMTLKLFKRHIRQLF